MRDGEHRSQHSEGFTLIELLIVIVILGVLAAVVVFAVGGIIDQGEVAASTADEKTIVIAQEAYMAQHGEYTSEEGLVSAGLLHDESSLFDVDLAGDAQSYAIGGAGSFPGGGGGGGGATTTTVPVPTGPQTISFATGAGSVGAEELNPTGTRLLAIIGSGTNSTSLWTMLQSTPPADTRIVWFDQGDLDTDVEVDALLAQNPDYMIAPYGYRIGLGGNPPDGSSPFIGQYLQSQGLNTPNDYWWVYQQGNVNPTLAQVEAGLAG